MPSPKILMKKKKAVKALAEELKAAQSIIFSDYQGLTVAQDTEMRSAFRKEGLVYKVIKNTISIRALEAIGVTGVEEELKGPTALAYSPDDVVLAPRLVKEFADKFKKKDKIKGGVVDGEKAELATILALANIPSLNVLHGQLVSTLIFPVTQLAMTLNAIAKKAEEAGVATVGELAVDAPKDEAPKAEEAPVEAAAPAEEAPKAEEAAEEAAAPVEEAPKAEEAVPAEEAAAEEEASEKTDA